MKVEENELLESQVTDDQVQDDEDLAFESGFDDSIETPLGETSSSESQAEQAQEAQIQEVVEQNPHLTESQVRELFEHNNQRLYGKFGEVQREIKRLEALAQQSFEQREQAQPLNITAEHFSNMREEFGEDFAAALARDLAGLPLGGSGQGLGQAQIDELVTQRTESLKNDFEMKIVEVQHPDWQDVAASDDFKGWVAQLPVDVQDQLNNTWDSKFVARALSAYKNDRDLHLENIKKAQLEQQAAEKAKQKKLQAAVLPRSTGRTSDEYDDDFEAGFNS
jgi:hypothetical protein